VTALPLRQAVRALVLDPDGRTLLTRFDFPPDFPETIVWASPGGGVEPGESDQHALRRELAEEVGLRGFELGPLLWTRTHVFAGMDGWSGQTERHYLVRTDPFEPRPELDVAAESIVDIRWFELDQLTGLVTAPRRLPEYLAALLRDGSRPPFDAGV
jgi:8-oxo-dGTP diphosphatase